MDKFGAKRKQKLNSTSSLSSSESEPESIIRETKFTSNRVHIPVKKSKEDIDASDDDYDYQNGSKSKMSCCNRKCACIFLILLYVCFDFLINAFFVTRQFTQWPDFVNYSIESSMVDVWCVSVCRDIFTLVVTIIFAATTPSHRFAYLFVRWIHKNYVSSFLCLIMYAYSMIKMLLHADQRRADRNLMLMFMWNIAASFLFFISIYMLALSKPKIANYHTTDGDDDDENNANERDIFIETLKETNQKRSSLSRLFRYSRPDWHLIVSGTIFLLLGAICNYISSSSSPQLS